MKLLNTAGTIERIEEKNIRYDIDLARKRVEKILQQKHQLKNFLSPDLDKP